MPVDNKEHLEELDYISRGKIEKISDQGENMTQILTLDSMKNLSTDEIVRLYQLGYRIENLVDPVVNFGKVTVSTGYNNLATSIVLNTGDGTKLPNPATDGAFNLTWYNSTDYSDPSDDPFVEIVRVTGKATDTLTTTRAQEGTLATNKNIAGKTYKMILSPTRKTITDINAEKVSKAGDTMTGVLDLPTNGLVVGTNQLIVSGGNIGIGTTNPLTKLHVFGKDANQNSAYFSGDNINKRLAIANTGGISYIASYDYGISAYTRLDIGGNPVTISQGSVGIGTTTPNTALSVVGNIAVTTNNKIYFNNDTDPSWTFGLDPGYVYTLRGGGGITGRGLSVLDITSGLSRFFVDFNTGNVGIGTTTPGALLTIQNNPNGRRIELTETTYPVLKIIGDNSTIGGYGIWESVDIAQSSGWFSGLSNGGNYVIGFGTAWPSAKDGPKLTILQNGNVSIGSITPSYLLQLAADSAAKPGTNTWTISSDERIKKDIRPFTDGIQTILNINPVWYKYNGKAGFKDDDIDHIGVIGQEIKDIVPYTINTYKAKLNEDDKEETELLNFNSHALTFVLINAIKGMKKEMDSLKEKIDYLKEEIRTLRKE